MQNWIMLCMSPISIHEQKWIGLQDGGETIFYLTHPGVYRKRLVTTTTQTPEHIVQFAHQSKVPSEMNLFVGMMRVSVFPLPLSSLRIFAEMPRGEGHLSVCGGCLDSCCVWRYPPFHREWPLTICHKMHWKKHRMEMAVFPACLHPSHSFVLATLPSISVYICGRNTCKRYKR